MKWYITGWKCTNIKVHAKWMRNANKTGTPRNPTGKNQFPARVPPKPKSKGPWDLVICPLCRNGRRRQKAKCSMCKGYGKIWAIP